MFAYGGIRKCSVHSGSLVANGAKTGKMELMLYKQLMEYLELFRPYLLERMYLDRCL